MVSAATRPRGERRGTEKGGGLLFLSVCAVTSPAGAVFRALRVCDRIWALEELRLYGPGLCRPQGHWYQSAFEGVGHSHRFEALPSNLVFLGLEANLQISTAFVNF